jgi:biotin transport system substrate-specific component
MKLNYKPEKNLLWQAPTVLVALIVGAKLTINIGIVPITMQTLALCITCLYFSRQANLLGTFLYLVAGMYLPVFSKNIYGKEFYFGLTAGYIFAFPFAVILITNARQYFKSWFTTFSWLLMGHVLIMVFGVAWGIFYHKLPYQYAMDNGFFNILPTAILKSLVVSLIYWLFKKYINIPTEAVNEIEKKD